MRFQILPLAAALLTLCQHAVAKAVFAHFMVDNTEAYSESKWKADISRALTAGIDGFALNMAAGSENNDAQVPTAFSAAASLGFKLIFSFDYAGNGPWEKADVISMLNTYGHHAAYFQHGGSKPLVSTFEGPDNADDWHDIKAATGCFLIPDWSSLGAQPAVGLANGVADGLFSWNAWPYGAGRADTYDAAAYGSFLDGAGGKPFMVAVSPWFYTNLPGYKKNWMWPDPQMRTWPERWTHVLSLDPEYVQIISWNDYGESHYIGDIVGPIPYLEKSGYAAFDFITGMDHTPWLWPLEVWIKQYKEGKATVKAESLVVNYLLHPVSGCSDGGTSINTFQQLQLEESASSGLNYHWVGYIATLASEADIKVTVGGKAVKASWIAKPAGGAGVYYGAAVLESGMTGDVAASITRDGATIISFTSDKPIDGCKDGFANFNPYVFGKFSMADVSGTTKDVSELKCIQGRGNNDFNAICTVVCSFGYCPPTACVCDILGEPREEPKITGDEGHALFDPNYEGLCSWVYDHGYKGRFDDVCSSKKIDLAPLDYSPFLPPTCTGGEARGEMTTKYGAGMDDLCGFLCTYGYCPRTHCLCTKQGRLIPLDNAEVPDVSTYIELPRIQPETWDDTLYMMCNFACDETGLCMCSSAEDAEESLEPVCDWTRHWESLAAMSSQNPDNHPVYCWSYFILDALSGDVQKVLAQYGEVNSGYDELFGYYKKYIEKLVDPMIHDFMRADGFEHFECQLGINGQDSMGTVKCPDPDDMAVDGALIQNTFIQWSLINETGFNTVLHNKYGIAPDWVKYGQVGVLRPCNVQKWDLAGNLIDCSAIQQWKGYPMKAGSIGVPNPKDFFVSAGDALNRLPVSIDSTLAEIRIGEWGGSPLDSVDVYSLPVSMAAQALDAMREVKDIGETEKEEEMKMIIGIIVMAILAVVPFVGEAAASGMGLATLARTIAIAGEAANAGYDIYTIVEDPDSAPMAVFGMLLGAGGVATSFRSADNFETMGARTRTLRAADMSALGTRVKGDSDIINGLVRSCKV